MPKKENMGITLVHFFSNGLFAVRFSLFSMATSICVQPIDSLAFANGLNMFNSLIRWESRCGEYPQRSAASL